MSHTEQEDAPSPLTPTQGEVTPVLKKSVDPKTVGKFLVRTTSLKKRKKVIDTWLATEWNGEQFLSSVLFKQRFLTVCFDVKFQQLLASTVSLIIKQDPSRLALFKSFLDTVQNTQCIKLVHVQSTLTQCLAKALLTHIDVVKGEDQQPLRMDAFQQLVILVARLYGEHPKQYCNHQYSMIKFAKTSAFKLVKRVQDKLSHEVKIDLLERIEKSSRLDEFIIAANSTCRNAFKLADQQSRFTSLVCNSIIRATQADVTFHDDGKTTWTLIFKQISSFNSDAMNSELVSSIEKAYKRGRDRVSGIIAELFSVMQPESLTDDVIDMIKSPNTEIKSRGVSALRSALASNTYEKYFDAVSELLKQGGLSSDTKIAVFSSLAFIAQKSQKHLDLLLSYMRVVSEADEVKAQIFRTISSSFVSESLPLTDPVFESLLSSLSSRKGSAATNVDTDVFYKSIIECLGDNPASVAKISDALVKKFIEFLGNLIVGSEKKVTDRVLAVYACLTLLKLSDTLPLAEKELKRSNIYSKVLGSKTPFLISADILGRLVSEHDYVVFAQLFKVLLLNDTHLKSINISANQGADILTTASKVLANTVSWNAQQLLVKAIKENKEKPITKQLFYNGFCSNLLKEVQERQDEINKKAQVYTSVELEKDDEETSKTDIQPYTSKTLGEAFLGLAPVLNATSTVEDATGLLLYAHHPLILYQLSEKDTKRNVSKLWESYIHQYGVSVLDLLRSNAAQTTDALIAKLVSEDVYTREAAANALATLSFIKQKATNNELVHSDEITGSIVLESLSKILRESSTVFQTLSEEDCEVFSTPANTTYHDIEVELANNPLYKSKDSMPLETPKYSLTPQEWEEVSKREEEIHIREKQRQQKEKSKKEVRSVQEIRKALVTQKVLEKEAAVRSNIQKHHSNAYWALRACHTLAQKQRVQSCRSRAQPYHIVIFFVANLFGCPFSDLAEYAKKVYIQIAEYQLSVSTAFARHQESSSPSAYGLAVLLANATYRLAAGLRDQSRAEGVDNDVKFSEYVILKLKLSLQGHAVSAPTFAALLPFLSQVLNRKNVLVPKDKRLPSSSLSTAMSVLSIHAGLESLVPETRESVARVCIEEVLNYIPHLSKQAHNALLAMAPFLSVTKSIAHTDLEPIVHGIIYSESESTRLAVLKTIEEYIRLHYEDMQEVLSPESSFVHAVFYAQFDEVESHVSIATQCWTKVREILLANQDEAQQKVTLETLSYKLRDFCYSLIGNASDYVKYTAAAALAGSLHLMSVESEQKTEEFVASTIATLTDMYSKNIMLNEHISLGVSGALIECAELFKSTSKHLEPVFEFIFNHGLIDEIAPDEFVNAGLSIVYHQGEHNKEYFINLFENFLKSSKSKTDYTVGSIVVFLGTVAKHLQASDERLVKVIDRLIQTLSVQSNTVQQSVANALVPLVKTLNTIKSDAIQTKIDEMIDRLFAGLKKGKSYGDRRGMAWGLAGATKGLGVSNLYRILKRLHIVLLKEAKNEKKTKEGVLLAYECLARMFGRLFEPYLVEVIPNIVFEGFSDSSKDVRQCANDAATQIMAHMTGHGVRMILPGILKSVAAENTSNWRQKKANIELLGHMAYCAPRQLATDLPVVVRALSQNLADAHTEVAESAKKSLERVGGGVANPEITTQVPIIIQALEDPEKHAEQVLEALIHTRFTHSIDGTSLALLIPILLRGLKERSTAVKRKSAQILGSMSALTTDPRDLMPYIDSVVPLLKATLMDSNPNVRTASAKAFGSLGKSIGEDKLGDAIAWLKDTINRVDARITAVERAGAAQALSEIISAQGVGRLKEVLPEILDQIMGNSNEKSLSNKNIREGYLQMFIYLPSLMRSKFEQFLPTCLPVILKGLSDSAENVRETALASSKVIVELFATSPTSLELLFPALNAGMEHEEWRTRHSSVQLMYEFLLRLSKLNADKIRTNANKDEEDEETEEEQQEITSEPSSTEVLIDLKTITAVLGSKTIDHILAVLFILQNDVHGAVRSAATQLWRATVVNTPKVLKSIIHSSLIGLLISHLNKTEEQSVIAGKAMGELVLKLGENIVAELIPLLTEQLKSDDSSVRYGVCTGLKELMNSTSERVLQKFTKILLPAIKLAVCDRDTDVQEAASEAFDVLCRVMGSKAVSEVIYSLMKDLTSDNESVQTNALSGLRQLIAVRPQQVLPKLVPALIKKPVTLTQARALSSISNALGGDSEQTSSILQVYIEELCSLVETQAKDLIDVSKIEYKEEEMSSNDLLPSILLAIHSVLGTIDLDNVMIVVEINQTLMDDNNPATRRAMLLVLQLFFDNMANTDSMKEMIDDEEFAEESFVNLLQSALRAFNDPDTYVVKAAWHAVSSMMKIVPKDNLPNYINPVRDAIRSQTEDDQGNRILDQLPGFNVVPQGLDPLINIFLQGLRYGKNVEVREQAALGLGDFIALSSAEALGPFVRNITGPLILVVGDRFPWQVKAAILNTLSLMLEKGGAHLKPFMPPLQTAFIKSLQDSTEVVRNYAVQCLAKLVPMNPRIEGLITELLTTLKKQAFLKSGEKAVAQFDQQASGVCIGLLEALRGVLSDNVLKTLKPTVLQSLIQTLLVIADIRENTIVPQSVTVLTDADNNQKTTGVFEKIRKSTCDCLAQCLGASTEFSTILESDIISDEGEPNTIESRLCLIDSIFQANALDKLTSDQVNNAVNMVLDNMSQNVNGVRAGAGVLVATLFGKKGASIDVTLKKSLAKQLIEEFKNALEGNTSQAALAMRYEIIKGMKLVAKKFKKEGVVNTAPLFEWVQPLMQIGIKDRYVPVKLCSERALFYILNQSGDAVSKYVTSSHVKDEKEGKLITDYCTRVLKRLSEEDSEEEEE